MAGSTRGAKKKGGQLGHGDTLNRLRPALVETLHSVCSIAAADADHSLAVTQSGDVFMWGRGLLRDDEDDNEYSVDSESWEDLIDLLSGPISPWPTIVEGFG
jgi:alpha-tubulin suppressor-like RCC1 family protein